jgi:hypothetical protein
MGCSNAKPEDLGEQTSHLAAPIAVKPTVGAGFFHSIAHSKFHLGSAPTNVSSLGLDKVVGSEGSFAVDPRNGSVLAILNGDSPALTGFKPSTTDPTVHNAQTLEYFKGAGLPPDQIGDVQALASKRGGSDATGKVQEEFTGYATEVHRVVAGFRVPDSFAWAIFDANGEVVQEGVHWPAIPDAVIGDAVSLRAVVSNGNQLAGFKALLPSEAALDNGQVVVRHGGVAEANPAPFASYDVFVKSRGSRGGVRHFNIGGKELVHPSSKVNGVSSLKP